MARLQAVVDLPSLATELVTTTVRGGLSTSTKRRLVRSVRKASPRPVRESICDTSGFFCASPS